MTEPDRNDPAPSEKTKPDAASPPAEPRPDSPASQPARIQPLDAPLFAVPGSSSIRPPASSLPRLAPKPSTAPPPRLRKAAPDSPNNIGPGATSPPLLSDAEITATQEIAEALSNAHRSESRPVANKGADPAPSSARATAARAQLRQSGIDPLSFRRTIIPILLTGTLILAGAGALLRFGGEDNALSDLFPGWVPIVLGFLATIFFALAILNMLAVKNGRNANEARRHEGT